MAELFFKKLAEDILTIEINTIIKSDMLADKMPNSRRQVLYELAEGYRNKLEEINVRQPIYWKYAGIRSFEELRNCAQSGKEKFNEELKEAPQEEKRIIREKISMLERINCQSSHIVRMFEVLEQEAISDGKDNLRAPELEPVETDPAKIKPAESHTDSQLWNNDIEQERMNKIPDLNLSPDYVIMIRKAWDIGTEQIILQTTIQLDGDITTRTSEGFFAKPSSNLILQIHNDSIKTSINFWSGLVKAFSEIAGEAIKSILSK